jgi:hypothetical protein
MSAATSARLSQREGGLTVRCRCCSGECRRAEVQGVDVFGSGGKACVSGLKTVSYLYPWPARGVRVICARLFSLLPFRAPYLLFGHATLPLVPEIAATRLSRLRPVRPVSDFASHRFNRCVPSKSDCSTAPSSPLNGFATCRASPVIAFHRSVSGNIYCSTGRLVPRSLLLASPFLMSPARFALPVALLGCHISPIRKL